MFNLRRSIKLVFFSFLCLINSVVTAVEINYGLDASMTRIDNINLTLTPSKEEWVTSLTGNLSLVENSSELIANINASLSHKLYDSSTHLNKSIANLSANARWIIKPKQLDWFISDLYTQSLINPLGVDIQSNRQDTNVFSTGPNYYWRINSINNVNLEARLGKVNSENKVGDNTLLSTATRWVYKVNSRLNTSINSESIAIDYNDNTIGAHTRRNLYAKVDYKKARNTYTAEAGTTSIDYEKQDNQTGQRYFLSINSERTRQSTVNFTYKHNISDAGTKLISNVASSDSNLATDSASTEIFVSDIYTDDSINLNYIKKTEISSYSFGITERNQSYNANSDLDRNISVYTFKPTYYYSPVTFFSLEASKIITNYKNLDSGRQDIDENYKLKYNYRLRKNMLFNIGLESIDRASTDQLQSYKDNRINITLSYTSI